MRDSEERLRLFFDNVREYDPDLAQKILDEMFVFENLMDLDDRGILWYLCRKKDVVPARTATLYPDAIEAMFNLVTGVPLSAVVYEPTVDALFYVLSEADAPTDFDIGTLAILAERVNLPAPRIILLPNALPADPRHNSKIDRVATLRQVQAVNKAGA